MQYVLNHPAALLAVAFTLFMALSNAFVFIGKATNSPRLESFARKAGGFIIVAEKIVEDVEAAPSKLAAASVFIQDVDAAIEAGDVPATKDAFVRLKLALTRLVPGLMKGDTK